MNRIGIDLARLVRGEPLPANHTPDCPGSSLRVTRHDFDHMAQGGEHFQTERKDVPVDGYGTARVRCSQAVERVPGTRYVMFYGLCSSCSRLEADNRMTLRERAGAKGER